MTTVDEIRKNLATPPMKVATKEPGEMGKDDFMKLLVAQLRFQNPMAPTDPAAFMQQSTQLATMERLDELSKATNKLLAAEQSSSAASMLRQDVTWIENGVPAHGTVSSVRLGGDVPMLMVGDKAIPFTAVVQIGFPEAAPAVPSTDETPDAPTDAAPATETQEG